MTNPHVVTAIVEGQLITGWQSGSIESSMVTSADRFVMRMPYNLRAANTLRRDARITIKVDGSTTILDGFIEKRRRDGRSNMFEIEGRDRVGRLVDEAAQAIDYSGMTILEAVKRLAFPWFDTVTLSNARNRGLRRGKGRRMASATEPVITVNVRVPRRGTVHAGESRWQMIHEIVSRAGLVAFASADGKELVICKPNAAQPAQYLFMLAKPGSSSQTNVRNMITDEDDGERFSSYICAGSGGQGDTNFGTNGIDNRGNAFDNPFNRIDGTGRDFIHPKRMYLPEQAYDSYNDAQRVAENEQARRDMKRNAVTVEAPFFGQLIGTSSATLFATDTVARVVDEEAGLDDNYLILSCNFSFDRDNGDTTNMHMVPVGTEIVL